MQVIYKDMKKLGLRKQYAQDRKLWKRLTSGGPSDLEANPEWDQLCCLPRSTAET